MNARLYEQLREANRAKDEFLSTLSHELRTPLTPILGWIHLLKPFANENKMLANGLATVERNANQLAGLIRDLLDVTRIESGTFAVRQARVHVRALLDETLELFEAPARERRVHLSCHVDEDVAPVLGDRDQLSRVLSNLIGNALKFTPPDGYVTVRAVGGENEVTFHVTDSGPGIAPEQIPHLFEQFWQARNDKRGVGLGLAIAKGIADAHGGSIWCDTALGQGSTFSFTLPRVKPMTAG